MDELSFSFLNTGSPTCLHATTATSTCIDLSLVSLDALLDFSWEVLPDDYGSDHFPVVLTPVQSLPATTTLPRWIFTKADWVAFSKATLISQSASNFPSTNNCLEFFEKTILTAAETNVPRSSGLPGPRKVHWWNSDCKTAVANKKKASRRFHRTHLPEHRMEMRRQKAISRRTLKLARRSSWRGFVSTISSDTPSTTIWRKVRSIEGKHAPPHSPVIQTDNAFLYDPDAVANELAKSFAEISKQPPSDRTPNHLPTFPPPGNEPYNRPFSIKELKTALNSRKSSAPGPDNLPYDFYHHLHPTATHFLLELFNRIWIEESFPSRWREAIIVPIPKPGKNPLLASSYRPIALTCCSCKIFEKMVATRLSFTLESQDLYPPTQAGFRPFRGTMDPLLLISHDVQEAFSRRGVVLAVFFDIQKAYDTTRRRVILETLKSLGFVGFLPAFISNFLLNRTFRVRVGTALSASFLQEEGVPQGSVLSVICFSIVMNTVYQSLPNTVKSSIYADDLAVYCSGRNPSLVERQIQLAINSIAQWSSSVGFTLSSAKTACLLFRPPRYPDTTTLSLTINGTPLNPTQTVRFLGMTLDNRLNWIPHISKLKNTAQRSLCLLDHLSHTTWGADRKTLTRLYISIVQSKLDYGCSVYSSASPSALEKLNTIQNRGLRIASGAFRSSPATSLQVECHLPPLAIRRTFLSLKSFTRICRLPSSLLHLVTLRNLHPDGYWHFTNAVSSYLEDMNLPQPRVLSANFKNPPPWILTPIRFCKHLCCPPKGAMSDHHLRKLFLDHSSLHSSSEPIYTDGSRSSTGVASAVVFPSSLPTERSFRLPNEASIFTAELLAILEALQGAMELPQQSFCIYSDSRSCLASLELLNPPHPIVQKIQQQHHHLVSTMKKMIIFCWVPAHVGIPGNEAADKAAKSACLLPIRQQQIPFTDYIPSFRRYTQDLWQHSWDTTLTNKLYSIKPRLGLWASSFHKDRHKEVVLTRLRIGHTHLTHGYLMCGEQPPLCTPCQVRLSVHHILIECPQYSTQRNRIYPNLVTTPFRERLHLILSESPSFSRDKLFNFLLKTQLLYKI